MTMKREREDNENDGEPAKDENRKEKKKLEKEMKRQRKEDKKQRKEQKRQKKEEKKRKLHEREQESNDEHSQQKADGNGIADLGRNDESGVVESVLSYQPSTRIDEIVRSQEETQTLFHAKRFEFSIALLPEALGNVMMSIEDGLAECLLRYHETMNGVLLAYDNIQILDERKGQILDDLPHIHYKVMADTVVYSPQIGCKLRGVVTESFQSHISLTVLSNFNSSITSDHLISSGFMFDTVKELWYQEDKNNVKRFVELNDEIDFICDEISDYKGIMSIDGSHPMMIAEQL